MSSKKYKFAIIGSHFTGKTTLVNSLYKHLIEKNHKVGTLLELVRECPFPINEMATVKAQDWILNEQKKRESELQEKYDIIITDRGLIDNFAYWLRVARNSKLHPEKIKKKEEEVFEHTKGYDAILFLQPFNSEIMDDKFRSTDPKWRTEMHNIISEVVERFEKKYNTPVIIVNGSKEDFFNGAKKHIDQIINPS